MKVQLCASVSHQNKLRLLWLHKLSNPRAHHCRASGFTLLHLLPGKPLWDLTVWITSSPSATPSSTETRPWSTEDAPRGDPQSWAMQGTEVAASLDTSGKRGWWVPRPLTSTCTAEHRQVFKGAVIVPQALCTFRKSLWRDLEYFIVHFDLLPSVLCCRERVFLA